MSILLKGLKIKPPNANQTGSLFGDAIYFADKFTKSINYSADRYRYNYGNAEPNDDGTFFLLLCEVALGNVANYSSRWTQELYRPPEGYHSIRRMSSNGPNFAQTVINDKLQVWPIGEQVKYPKV